MIRKFKHTKEGHNKWWNVQVEESTYTVSFGRVGAKGSELTKTFASPAKAKEEAEKLIASKLKKGYEEIVTAARTHAIDEHSIEGRLNRMLMNFSLANNVDISYIEDCEFREEPRAMEFDRKYADDTDMDPLRELALAIDMHILGTPRTEAAKSASPYVRDCAQWYSQRWDPMFTHDEEAAKQLIETVRSRGPESLRLMGVEPKYSTPVGRSVILPDRVLKDSEEIARMGREAKEGTVWIVAAARGAERYIKVSSLPEVWCPLM